VSMGGRADRQACADGERGPPSARAEYYFKAYTLCLYTEYIVQMCYEVSMYIIYIFVYNLPGIF
jgi:hypothetical protein